MAMQGCTLNAVEFMWHERFGVSAGVAEAALKDSVAFQAWSWIC